MKQLTQQLKSGKMEILEVPFPVLEPGHVLVRNHFSVISTGTEGKTVRDARKGYIAKARSRRKEVEQVIDLIKKNGLKSTYKLVMNKLEAPSPLGYSCAGEVIALGDGVSGLKVGDMVACGGQGAFHADVVSVSRNLCVRIPEGVDVRYASFATIAAIAVQGIRQADLRFGESCAVIGLGLIGQMTVQILKASGIQSIGIDLDAEKVHLAKTNGASEAFLRKQQGLIPSVINLTRGAGVDAVIITASSSSEDPVNLAGEICRKKGKVVVVGAVPTGFERPHYYRKELDLRMSCSYGPGRYDPTYEDKGIDYPIGYVRWTEQRNMQSFLDLLSEGRLKPEGLITKTFYLENVMEAYDMVLDSTSPVLGLLIQYRPEIPLENNLVVEKVKKESKDPALGVIGAGSYAQNVMLPILQKYGNFTGLSTVSGTEAVYIAKKYQFSYCSDDPEELFRDEGTNTLFILTPHHLHAELAIKALKVGKNVFVEKPMAINEDELNAVKKAYMKCHADPIFMVGFNRRFSPHARRLTGLFPSNLPKALNFRINAVPSPPDHWVHDPKIGGGRVVGEICHFIDLAVFLTGSEVISISASGLQTNPSLDDTVTVQLSFKDGSIASISYFSNGSRDLPKEYLEIFCGGITAVIEDFRKMTVFGEKKKSLKLKKVDKGHNEEVRQFMDSVKKGTASPIPFSELFHTSLVTLKVLEAMREKRTILIE